LDPISPPDLGSQSSGGGPAAAGRRAAGGGEAFTACLTRERRRRVTCLDSRPAGDVRATAGRRALVLWRGGAVIFMVTLARETRACFFLEHRTARTRQGHNGWLLQCLLFFFSVFALFFRSRTPIPRPTFTAAAALVLRVVDGH